MQTDFLACSFVCSLFFSSHRSYDQWCFMKT